jgi:hypothetical protein
MSTVDRSRIEQLLTESSLSYREIARQVGCSDWSVRAVAHELVGDERPIKDSACSRSSEPLESFGFVAVIGVIACFIVALYFFTRGSWLLENEPNE